MALQLFRLGGSAGCWNSLQRDNSCKLSLWNSYFHIFFNPTFFFWLFCAHLNQIQEREVLLSAEAFSCFAFLHYLSPRASGPLWGHSGALVRSPSELCRISTSTASHLLTMLGSAGELCCECHCVFLKTEQWTDGIGLYRPNEKNNVEYWKIRVA